MQVVVDSQTEARVHIIDLGEGLQTIVDEEDYKKISCHSWYINKSGRGFIYARCRKLGYMHRVILGLQKGDSRRGDHINHNTLDNRKCNLRIVTGSQNIANRIKTKKNNSSSKYKGVRWNKQNKKWTARIKINYKEQHLRCFKTELEAANAYDEKALEIFGEYSLLNCEMEGLNSGS